MENEIEKPRWWAQALLIGAIVSAVLMVMAGFGTRMGMWSYTGGFTIASGGVMLAAAVFFLGVIGYVVCLRKGLRSERSNILVGLLICAVLLGQFGMQMNAVSSVPRIHNISTDTLDPPVSMPSLQFARRKAQTRWFTMTLLSWRSSNKRPILG